MNRLDEIKVISMESKLQEKDLTLCATSREREELLALFITSKGQTRSGKCRLMAEGEAPTLKRPPGCSQEVGTDPAVCDSGQGP